MTNLIETGAPLGLLASALVLGAILGAILATMFHGVASRSGTRSAGARYPRDWPRASEIFTRDTKHQGYYQISGAQVISNKRYSGAVRIGRLYPAVEWFRLVPDKWPFTRLREWVLRATTKEVWIPYEKRFQHMAILGATGKGKSTSFAYPQMVYGALEEQTSYLAIDVKSPQFVRLYSRLYKNAGKEVHFFDPWSIDETLAFEPLWRASPEVLNEISEVVATYSPSGDSKEGGNSEFFNLAAQRVMRGLVELAQFWPRRFCSLPCVQQLVVAGFAKVEDAFRNAPSLQPSAPEVLEAASIVVKADPDDLRKLPRDPDADITLALDVLDRAGYRTAHLVRSMRRLRRQNEQGTLSAEALMEAEERFEMEIETECARRKAQLEKLIESQGEYLDMPDETKGSVMSTLTNKIAWFQDANVARAFSRDEIDVRRLVEGPCLFLIGAPMSKLNVGSLFCASIMTNLAINAIFTRGAALDAGAKNVWTGGVNLLLDEFPQLNIRKASQALATFRGFKGALMLIYQDRGQLKKLAGEDFTNIEANTIHQVLMQGAHLDTCEFYAKALGETSVEQRSESKAEGESKKNVSMSLQRVKLMEVNDIHDMRLNGSRKEKMALSVGAETPPFPFIPVPFWEDPIIRKLLGMERKVVKNGPFWEWEDKWSTVIDADDKYIHRRKRTRGMANDPVAQRLDDEYGQYLDFLIGKPKEVVQRGGREQVEVVYDELELPNLKLAVIVGTKGKPAGQHPMPGAMPPKPFPPAGPTAPPKRPPAPPASGLVHTYSQDLKRLVGEDFSDSCPIENLPASSGTIAERLAALRNTDSTPLS